MIYKFIEKEAFQIIGVKRTYNFRDGENDKGIPHFWKEVLENGINKRLVNLNNGNIKGVLGVCIFDENQKKKV